MFGSRSFCLLVLVASFFGCVNGPLVVVCAGRARVTKGDNGGAGPNYSKLDVTDRAGSAFAGWPMMGPSSTSTTDVWYSWMGISMRSANNC